MVVVEVIDSAARLQEFQCEWVRFARALGPATPFQTPQWLLTWWAHFGSGRPHVLVFRSAGLTVGILPCFLHDWRGRRQLTMIGTGISDYLDPLFDELYRDAIMEALQAHLAQCGEWEVCDWQDLAADTPLRALGATVEDTPCSRITLEGRFHEFLAARPADLRRSLRRDKRKAQAAGRLQFTVTAQADPAALHALIHLHTARWHELGEPGMIESNGAAGFLRQAAAVLAGEQMVRIFTLYFRHRIAAVIMALCNRTAIYAYLSGFDPEFEEFSFGRELLATALEDAHRQGYRYWDFLRGNEPYKSLWGARLIPRCRLRLERATDRVELAAQDPAIALR